MKAASLQDILCSHGRHHKAATPHTANVLRQLRECRTHAMGYHVYDCDNSECTTPRQYRYNSCSNRHCPQCGGLQKEAWMEQRTSELLPVKYYHVVFTMPHELNSICMGNRQLVLKLLMDSSWYTLQKFSADKKWMGATPGVISVLHTWGQQLSFHPHVHCIVSGGGIDEAGKWTLAKKSHNNYLFSNKAMMPVYRGRLLNLLQLLKNNGALKWDGDVAAWNKLMVSVATKDWVVYAKQPFGGPQSVIEYLARYTHKSAISNSRIKSIDAEGNVLFNWKDYAGGNKNKQMKLPAAEFIRRFEQHILPKGFTRIRHYGYLANRGRTARIEGVLASLELPAPKPVITYDYATAMLVKFGVDVHLCKCCGKGRLTKIASHQPARAG